jgi:hypothetical protein
MSQVSILRGIKILVVIVWLAALLTFIQRVFLPAAKTITYGFMGYYTASWLFAHGQWTPEAYGDARFNAQVETLSGGQVGDIISYNPPAVALILWPLAGLSPERARWIWTLTNGMLLALACGIMFQTTTVPGAKRSGIAQTRPVNGWLWLALSALALAYAPLAENFRFGQVYVFLLLLYVVGLWALVRERDTVAGVAFGLAGVLKLSGLPIWLLLLIRRWPRLPWRLCAAACALVVLSIPLVTPAMYFAFLSRIPAELGSTPWVTLTVYQTTNSFFAHFLRFDAHFNPSPLANLPLLADGLTLLIVSLSLTFTLWRSRFADLTLAFAAATVLSVILYPVAEQYHYTLLLLPLALLAADITTGGGSSRFILAWALAAALLALPLPYRDARLSTGWLSLLAYPRLYGGWLLWGLLVARMKNRTQIFGADER